MKSTIMKMEKRWEGMKNWMISGIWKVKEAK